MAFLLAFLQFLQPGVLFPALAPYRPIPIVFCVCAGVILLTRPIARQVRALVHPVFAAVLLFVGAQVISVHYSGMRAMLEAAGFWYPHPIFVVLAVALVRDIDDLHGLAWGTVLGLQVIVVYGLYSVWAGAPRAGAYGMYLNHNDYSYALVLALPLMAMLRRTEHRLLVRFLLGCMMLTAAAGAVLSLSRWGILTLVVQAGLLTLFDSRNGLRAAAGIVAVSLIGGFGVQYLWQRRDAAATTYTIKESEASRTELWKAGKNMFLDRPLLGVGSGRFPEYSRQYYDLSGDQVGKNSHNTYIEILATTGLAGFVPFVALLYFSLGELRSSSGPAESARFRAVRVGAYVGLLGTMFRVLTNAKTHDWNIYTLAAIALCCASLRREGLDEDEDEEEADDAQFSVEDLAPPGGADHEPARTS